jgi:hypothetical protein
MGDLELGFAREILSPSCPRLPDPVPSGGVQPVTSGTSEEPSKRRQFLTDNRTALIVAAIGSVASVVTGFVVSSHSSSSASIPTVRAAPSVNITSPTDGANIPMALSIQGTVKNLRPNEDVVVYNEPVSDGKPSGTFYPGLGPCPVHSDGSWTCSVHVGSPANYGNQFYVWAAVVTSAQAYSDNEHATEKALSTIGFLGDDAPPHIGGAQAIFHRLVIRCLRDEPCGGS